ncbi:MAG TPA: aldehyde dehydrogenase family protein, partial [Candidatus Polarisedimenticolia bacterium]|nr:aldehyde dehydrogenase family protein [Candidatus Polarisedimenticolia bacterium]
MTNPLRKSLAPARLFIDGAWADPRSGLHFKTINPATEEAITDVAEAGPEDVDAAVQAAHKAFESGPWSKMSGADRGRILWKLGDLIEANVQELGRLETLDQGKTITEST